MFDKMNTTNKPHYVQQTRVTKCPTRKKLSFPFPLIEDYL